MKIQVGMLSLVNHKKCRIGIKRKYKINTVKLIKIHKSPHISLEVKSFFLQITNHLLDFVGNVACVVVYAIKP
jgi:hypothetical protein